MKGTSDVSLTPYAGRHRTSSRRRTRGIVTLGAGLVAAGLTTSAAQSSLAAAPPTTSGTANAAELAAAARLAAASPALDTADHQAASRAQTTRVVAAETAAREAAAKAAAQKAVAKKAALRAELTRREAAVTARASLASQSPRAIGKVLAAKRGWGASQFSCLNKLWTKESNWTVTADNPTSSAYGIPQALPGRKMASVGKDWRTNPVTQITWGLGYIKDRYRTPCNAWAHSRAHNWY